MLTPREIAEEIVEREGEYVNDPDDPGGPTKYGITLATAQDWGLDLDNDGDVDVDDVKLIAPGQATDLFLDRFFFRRKLDSYIEAIQPCVFDFSVHSGRNAVRVLQRLVATVLRLDIVVDGRTGPRTAQAVSDAGEVIGDTDLASAFAIDRREWYYALANRRPKSRKYCVRQTGGKGGWIVRAEQFMDAEWRLTPQQHRSKVEGWT